MHNQKDSWPLPAAQFIKHYNHKFLPAKKLSMEYLNSLKAKCWFRIYQGHYLENTFLSSNHIQRSGCRKHHLELFPNNIDIFKMYFKIDRKLSTYSNTIPSYSRIQLIASPSIRRVSLSKSKIYNLLIYF